MCGVIQREKFLSSSTKVTSMLQSIFTQPLNDFVITLLSEYYGLMLSASTKKICQRRHTRSNI
jgi:hypothetical protein